MFRLMLLSNGWACDRRDVAFAAVTGAADGRTGWARSGQAAAARPSGRPPRCQPSAPIGNNTGPATLSTGASPGGPRYLHRPLFSPCLNFHLCRLCERRDVASAACHRTG